MFGFIGKFKTEVLAGFEAIHQRLVTLEAQVGALFHHTQTVAEPVVTEVEAEGEKAVTVAEDAAKTVEAAVAPTTTETPTNAS